MEARLSSLRSGHSHEDVDQVFGRLSRFITRHGRFAQTPSDFIDIIRRFLSEADFPFEHASKRYVRKIDQTRDWYTSCT